MSERRETASGATSSSRRDGARSATREGGAHLVEMIGHVAGVEHRGGVLYQTRGRRPIRAISPWPMRLSPTAWTRADGQARASRCSLSRSSRASCAHARCAGPIEPVVARRPAQAPSRSSGCERAVRGVPAGGGALVRRRARVSASRGRVVRCALRSASRSCSSRSRSRRDDSGMYGVQTRRPAHIASRWLFRAAARRRARSARWRSSPSRARAWKTR